MNKFNKIYESILSKGIRNAMKGNMKIKTLCKCGYALPVYPGKYHITCPCCNNNIKISDYKCKCGYTFGNVEPEHTELTCPLCSNIIEIKTDQITPQPEELN